MQAVPPITEIPATGASRSANWKRFLPMAVLVAGLLAFLASGAPKYLSIDYLLQSRTQLAAFTSQHMVLALLIYAAIYVGAVALSIPGALLLTIAGGFLFGGWLGGSVTVVSATIGAVLVFLITRSSLGEPLARRTGPWIATLRRKFANTRPA